MSVALTLTALCALTAGARPGPRGPADFELAVYLPRLDRAAGFTAFLEEGGKRSVVLRPESWRDEFHPLLRLDLTRPDEVVNAGLDPAGPATLVTRGTERFSCTTLKDVARFEERCAERLKTLGDPWKDTVDGATLVGSRDVLGRVLAGYALKGHEACAVGTQGHSAEKGLREAAGWLGRSAAGAVWAPIGSLPGAMYLVRQDGVVAVKADGLNLTADAKGAAPWPGLSTGGPSPYALVPNQGLLTLRVRAAPGALPASVDSIARFLARLCPACDQGPFQATARALAPTLSGNAVVVVTRVKVQGSLRTDAGRYFAVRHAMLAECTRPDEARKALEPLLALRGAKALDSGDGLSLLLREGELRVGVHEGHLYLSNDVQVLEGLRASIGDKAGKQAHGAELWVDPRLLANGLSQVPLLDAVSSPELAGLLAVSTELGPMLLSTDRISGWADAAGAGAYRAQLGWKLKAPAPADAGRLAPLLRPDAGP